jgi:hypothetical protein
MFDRNSSGVRSTRFLDDRALDFSAVPDLLRHEKQLKDIRFDRLKPPPSFCRR